MTTAELNSLINRDVYLDAIGDSRRLHTAQDLAGVLLFLSSPAGAHVTGARIESEPIGTHTVTRWWSQKTHEYS